MTQIKLINYRPVDWGKTKATVDVIIYGIRLNYFKVNVPRGGKPYAIPPTSARYNQGALTARKVVELSAALKNEIEREILRVFAKRQQSNSTEAK